jgi:hypothetical protein
MGTLATLINYPHFGYHRETIEILKELNITEYNKHTYFSWIMGALFVPDLISQDLGMSIEKIYTRISSCEDASSLRGYLIRIKRISGYTEEETDLASLLNRSEEETDYIFPEDMPQVFNEIEPITDETSEISLDDLL